MKNINTDTTSVSTNIDVGDEEKRHLFTFNSRNCLGNERYEPIPLILLALTFVITAADEALQELAAGNLKFTAKSYKLGVQKVFSPQQSDLTGISRKGGLSVDFITQQTYINVTETGVEAAAATAVGVVGLTAVLGPPPVKIIYNADHPFLFYIRDGNSGVTLFAGRFNN
ncbi:hypothetical protein JTB14_010897 [Gonioctena quinquepunctata]|nr:hypothetical protein JTB14_010897 [Gonioctena quinquepunctata]